jgi:hypothetical protein
MSVVLPLPVVPKTMKLPVHSLSIRKSWMLPSPKDLRFTPFFSDMFAPTESNVQCQAETEECWFAPLST